MDSTYRARHKGGWRGRGGGGGSLFPAPIPLCVSFCAWTIHGVPTQSKDPYLVQDNKKIFLFY